MNSDSLKPVMRYYKSNITRNERENSNVQHFRRAVQSVFLDKDVKNTRSQNYLTEAKSDLRISESSSRSKHESLGNKYVSCEQVKKNKRYENVNSYSITQSLSTFSSIEPEKNVVDSAVSQNWDATVHSNECLNVGFREKTLHKSDDVSIHRSYETSVQDCAINDSETKINFGYVNWERTDSSDVKIILKSIEEQESNLQQLYEYSATVRENNDYENLKHKQNGTEAKDYHIDSSTRLPYNDTLHWIIKQRVRDDVKCTSNDETNTERLINDRSKKKYDRSDMTRGTEENMGHNLQKEKVCTITTNEIVQNSVDRKLNDTKRFSDENICNKNEMYIPLKSPSNGYDTADSSSAIEYIDDNAYDQLIFSNGDSKFSSYEKEIFVADEKTETLVETRNDRPVPPPTLPKYTSSFNAGSNLSLRDREKEGIGGSYRLASLDRLALRQRLIDQTSNNSTTGTNQNMSNGNQINGNDTNATANSIQSKRELFFKSDATTLSNNQNTHSTSEIKDALAKKALAADSLDTNRLSRVTVSEKTIPEPQLKTVETQKAAQELVKEKPKLKELDGYVGFANLPNQVYRKAVKKGFEFTLMVVGESGLGKSTLINSMFLTDIYESGPTAEFPGPSQRIKKTVNVETSRVLLKENGVNLTLTVVDTPGFGDAVDNSNCWSPIIEYIESKYEEYLNCESRVNRKQINDSRVHCCLYFIQPSGHGLKPLDIEFMQRLCDKVNIVPVIAKADTMTSDECQLFKKQILNEIAQHKIKIYEFPDSPDDQEDENKMNRVLKTKVPFAVVGSNTVIETDGKKLRGRKYPWGFVEVENLEHCDFIALRNMVIRTHLQDLKDVTNNVHYENYRCRKLAGLGVDGKPTRISNKNPLAQMEEEKKEHDVKMKKMELEMEQVFEAKVKEKKQKLKDSENELTRRNEQTKKQLEMQAKELDERRRMFEAEKAAWERENNISLEELRRKSLEANSKEPLLRLNKFWR